MGKVFQEIDDKLAGWISRQHIFFVGTAPAGDAGNVNVSPKGMAGTFAVLGPHRVAYLDYTGSGAETIAHLRDNGRIVLMFCAFDGPPKIVRLHGRGRVVLPGDPEFDDLRPASARTAPSASARSSSPTSTRISDSCGYSLPLMDFRPDRDVLDKDQSRRDEDYFPDLARQERREHRRTAGRAGRDAPPPESGTAGPPIRARTDSGRAPPDRFGTLVPFQRPGSPHRRMS